MPDEEIGTKTFKIATLTLPLVSIDPDCDLHSKVCVLQIDPDALPIGLFQEHHHPPAFKIRSNAPIMILFSGH
jgi:hypothetical protein